MSLYPWRVLKWYCAEGEIVLFNPISGHTHLLAGELRPVIEKLNELGQSGESVTELQLMELLSPYVDNAQRELACWLKLGLILESDCHLSQSVPI